jgi:hypothetical protein
MRLRKAVESLWANIGSAGAVRKPAKCAVARCGKPSPSQADDSTTNQKAEASSGSLLTLRYT